MTRRPTAPTARRPASCEWNLVNKAGNLGWPFCVGDQSPANTMTRWNYAANATTGQKYDCSTDTIPSDINYAPDGQTPGRADVPGPGHDPEADPGDDLEEVRRTPPTRACRAPLDFGNLTEGGMQPVAGPIYRYNAATVGSGGFPAYYDGSWLINNRGSNDGFWKEVRMRQRQQRRCCACRTGCRTTTPAPPPRSRTAS